MGARYYEPTSGRFLPADPLGHALSPFLYDFAGGDPVNFFDPKGRCNNKTSTNNWGQNRAAQNAATVVGSITITAPGSFQRQPVLGGFRQHWTR